MAKKAFVTRTFAREQIDEWGLPYEAGDMVQSDVMVDHGRWSLWHELIFQAPDDGKLWKLMYQTPATERQECERWPDLEAVQVETYWVNTIRFREVETEYGNTHPDPS